MNINYAPCAFTIDDVWYKMPYGLVLTYQNKVGKDWTNAKIVQAMRDDGWHFTDTRFKTPYK